MNGKRLALSGVLVLSAALLLGVGYVQAQTPGTICEFDPNGMCVDSPIVDNGGNIGIGITNAAFGKNPEGSGRLAVSSPLGLAALALFGDAPNLGGFFVTPWSADGGVNFSISTSAGSSAFDLLTLTHPTPSGPGRVGIGTTTPAFGKLTVLVNTGNAALTIDANAGGVPNLSHADLLVCSPTTQADYCFVTNAGSLSTNVLTLTGPSPSSGPGKVGVRTMNPAFPLDVSGDAHATSFMVSSDARFKKDVRPLTNVLEKIDKIRGVAFDWNQRYEALGRATGKREIGVIAQDVEAVFPELVTTWGDEGYRAVDYGRLTSVLVEAVKEQQRQIKELRAEIEGLRAKLSGE